MTFRAAIFRESITWLLVAYLYAASQTPARAGWYEFNPPGSVNDKGILQEVLSRSGKPQYFQQKYAGDLATMCHEATHIVNGEASKQCGANDEAFYIGGGKIAAFREPRITITAIGQRVPTQYRDGLYYQIYCVTQPSTQPILNAMPLYLMDEWSASINGAQAARELGVSDTGDLQMANQFCFFADAVLVTIRQLDPSYAELAELEEFVAHQKGRVIWLNSLQQQRPLAQPALAQNQMRGAETNTWRGEKLQQSTTQMKPMQSCIDGQCYGGGWQPVTTRPPQVVVTQPAKPTMTPEQIKASWVAYIDARFKTIQQCQCDHAQDVKMTDVNQAIAVAIANIKFPEQPPVDVDKLTVNITNALSQKFEQRFVLIEQKLNQPAPPVEPAAPPIVYDIVPRQK